MSVLGIPFPRSLTGIRLARAHLVQAVLLGVILAAFVAIRIGSGEDRYEFGWDEGAYLAVARLILSGFRIHSDILYIGPPAFVYSLASAFALFGATVGVARAVTLVFGLAGLVGAYFAGMRLGGKIGGLIAVILLTLNPAYFLYSWTVFTDLPAAALTVIALALTLHPNVLQDRRWMAASGIAYMLGVMMKPLVIPFAMTLGLIVAGQRVGQVLNAPKEDWRRIVKPLALDFAWFTGAALILPLVWFITSGPVIFGQLAVNGTISKQLAESIADSWMGIFSFLKRDTGLVLLGGLGAVLFLLKRPWIALAMIVGWVATVVLQFQLPTYYHHLVVLIPWFAVLGGGLLGWAIQTLAARGWRGEVQVLGLGLALIGLWCYLASVDYVVSFNSATITPAEFPASEAKAIQWLQSKTSSDEFIITDEPMIPFRAGRNLPPEVAVPAGASITVGYLTDNQLISVAEKHKVRVLVIWQRFKALPEWMDWVEQHYAPVKVLTDEKGGTHIIYVRMN